VVEEGAGLGCPEIRLGVFPPAASVLLPVRLGAARAAALVLTGRSMTGVEAAAAGLVARLAPDGGLTGVLDGWLSETFVPHSPVAMRWAAEAVRVDVQHALDVALPGLERLYLDRLMAEPDAVEGIRAFLDKREPRWVTSRMAG
jgi:cyclohexa-1,5-dienecarbonyl-CoA hydratase